MFICLMVFMLIYLSLKFHLIYLWDLAWNYWGFYILFIDIHIDLLMDMFSFKAKTSSSINGIVLWHQLYNNPLSINSFHISFFFLLLLKDFCSPLSIWMVMEVSICKYIPHLDKKIPWSMCYHCCMWVLHILIENPTYIELIVSKRIRNIFFASILNCHKIVMWFFLSFVNYC
jgi:hypothetical protein